MPIVDVGDAEWQRVRIADRLFHVPTRLRARYVDGEFPYNLSLSIELQNWQYTCTAFRASQQEDGPPVTLAGLRSIPIGTLVRRAIQVWLREERTKGPPELEDSIALSFPLLRRRPPAAGAKRIRRGPLDDLSDAAVIYHLASMCAEPPTKAVADTLRIPLGTARKLVSRARASGLIAEATLGGPTP